MAEYHSLESSSAPSRAVGSGQTFFMYHDKAGDSHVVDRLSMVPGDAKDVKKITLPADGRDAQTVGQVPQGLMRMLPETLRDRAAKILKKVPHSVTGGVGTSPDAAPGSTLAMGTSRPGDTAVMPYRSLFMTVAVIFLAAWVIKPLRGILLKVGVSVAGIALLGGIYLNWLSQHMGLVTARQGPVTPAAIIDEAQESAQALRRRVEADQNTLDQIHE